MPQTEIRRIGGTIQYRAAADGETPSRRIEGYALLFDTESAPFEDSPARHVVEVISPGAVTRELLDASDIEMNYNHDRARILARSVNGSGSLSYEIDERGVRFAFDAPATTEGDMILEHIRRGDLRGCSFCFSTDYSDPDAVSVEVRREDGREMVTIRHNRMTGIYDFAITPDPAYPDTSVDVRHRINAAIVDRIIAANPIPEDTPPAAVTPPDTEARAALRALQSLNRRIIIL